MKRRPKILLVSLGGTISTSQDREGHAIPALGAADLLTTVPKVDELADVIPADVKLVPSRAMSPQDMCHLAHRVRASVEEGCEGVVITHGTDTMEETAYALALQLDEQVPVVLTGAMRPAHDTNADGPSNLDAALRVAATPEAALLGPVVVMHGEVHLARWVTKVHTSRVAAFASPYCGPVGYISEGKVYLHTYPSSPDYLGLPENIDQRVELLRVAAGVDGLLVEVSSSASDGLVIAGTGGGHVPPAMAEALRAALERGVQIVLASRCLSGPVLESTYGGVGSETHLLSLGLCSAGVLSPLKARLRLLVALALGRDAEEVFPV